MKSEDARAIFLLEYCAEECAGYPKYNVCENCEINAAIEALEKQVPKKPTKYDIDYSGNPLFRCPVCGDSWNSNEFGDGIEHCWTCG